MGVSWSAQSNVMYFKALRFIARKIDIVIDWEKDITRFSSSLAPGTRIHNLKLLFLQVKTDVNMGRFLSFIRFADELNLTEEEWGELYEFLAQ